MIETGRVVILNGAPRSGKTSIARALLATGSAWVDLGVDRTMAETPPELLPAMGLRPGGERPDLEPVVVTQVDALFAAVAAQAEAGRHVVVDLGLHDDYSKPLGLWGVAAGQLDGLSALVVGVRCPLPEVMRRRNADHHGHYERSASIHQVPEPVRRWQRAVHDPGIYDIEVDTSAADPDECAVVISARLHNGPPPVALRHLAARG